VFSASCNALNTFDPDHSASSAPTLTTPGALGENTTSATTSRTSWNASPGTACAAWSSRKLNVCRLSPTSASSGARKRKIGKSEKKK
jgi:hypothetical protein